MSFLRIQIRSLTVALLIMIVSVALVNVAPLSLEEERISAVIVIRGQLNLERLDKSAKISGATRQARHEQVIEALQATAKSTQEFLLEYLEKQKTLGRVQEYQSFWITNAVTVTATSQVIEEIAQRPEVAAVYKDEDIGPIEPIEPIEIKKIHEPGAGAEIGLKVIRADCLWARGINGAGTLVSNLDTGVNGHHAGLFHRWRGNNGADPAESWFDPFNNTSFPVDNPGNNHGTMTLGIVTGMDGTDTVGVAFGAQWISANFLEPNLLLESIVLENFLACFQWLADPDGKASTIDDVPDVINCSFSMGWQECHDFLWSAIDAVEAASVVIIFAAGNKGRLGAYTVGNPASRTTSPVNAFAVGMVDKNNVVSEFSSRGPSRCDSVSVKPEVVAPGIDIRSFWEDGSGVGNGTSFAAPHVAGAVALLRQINPDASVEEIKYALLNSAIDSGPQGEDNDYGTGLIDVNAAAKFLPPVTRPNVNISKVSFNGEYEQFVPKGENTEIVVHLVNTGLTVHEVSVKLATSDPYCSVTMPSFNSGNIRRNEIVNNATKPFEIVVDSSALEGHNIVFDLEMVADGGQYRNAIHFSAVVEERLPSVVVAPSFVDIGLQKGERARSAVVISNLGSRNLEYEIHEVSPQDVPRPDVIPSVSAANTSLSAIRDPVGDMPNDYNFDIALVNITLVDTFVTFCRYRDSTDQIISDTFSSLLIETVLNSGNSFMRQPASYGDIKIFLDTDQNVHTGAYPPSVAWWTHSPAPISLLTALTVGPDFDIWGPNDAYCANSERYRLAMLSKNTTDGKRDYEYGVAALPLAIEANKLSIVVPSHLLGDEDGNMNLAIVGYLQVHDTTGTMVEPKEIHLDLVPDFGHAVIGIDPTPIPWLAEAPPKGTISPSGSSTGIHLVADATQLENFVYTSSIQISTNDPRRPLITIPVKVTVGDSKRPAIPDQFQLYQNYPNPFNASTTIEYQVSAAGRVSLEVFNLLGQRVRTLANEDKAVGYHKIDWDGKDNQGTEVASGVYLCRMKIKDFVERKKLVLVR